MTPLEMVAAVRSIGCELFIRDGELRIRKPNPAPPELDSILARIRQDREGVKAALSPPPPVCIDCRQPVSPNDLFCYACFQARKVVPLDEIARRLEARWRRTEARLQTTPCGSCGKVDWRVNNRGDACCRVCFSKGGHENPA